MLQEKLPHDFLTRFGIHLCQDGKKRKIYKYEDLMTVWIPFKQKSTFISKVPNIHFPSNYALSRRIA